MSWLSAAWKRNSNAIQSIVKPLVSHLPGGDIVASRMLMSPTAAQANVGTSVNTALASIAPKVAVVQQESGGSSATLPAPTPVGGPAMTSLSGITPTQLAIGGALVLALLFFSSRR